MYESWFHLKRRPFATAPSCETYFPAEGIATALQTVIRCMERGVGPALVIGGAGVGRSMLCLKLRAHFQTHRQVAAVAAGGVQSRKALLQSILFELGQPYRDADENELRLQLIDFLTSNKTGHGGTVVLVDEAEAMSDTALDEIRGLSNLVQNGEWSVRLLLCGKPVLEEALAVPAMESLNQRIAARCYLHPWGLRETEAYVRFQLERVGGNADQIFEAAGLRQVYESSGGIPRLVNQLCDHALVLATAGKSRRLDAVAIQEAWSDLQQLPPPMEPARAVDSEADHGIIEFGGLEDDPSLLNAAPESVPTEPAVNASEGTSSGSAATATDTARDELAVAAPATQPVEVPQPSEDQRFPDDPERRLDAIELEVSRVSEEFGNFVASSKESSHPQDQHKSKANDPFFEQFEDEEILIDRPAALHELVAVAERAISTDQGLALVEVLRLLEAEMEREADDGPDPPGDEEVQSVGDFALELETAGSIPEPAVIPPKPVPDDEPASHFDNPPTDSILFKFEDHDELDPPPTIQPDVGPHEPFRLGPPRTIESVWDGPLSDGWQSDSTIEFESWQPSNAEQFSQCSTPAEPPEVNPAQPQERTVAANEVPEEESEPERIAAAAPPHASETPAEDLAGQEPGEIVMPAPTGLWVEETTLPASACAEPAPVGNGPEQAPDAAAESTTDRPQTPARDVRQRKFRRLFVDLNRK